MKPLAATRSKKGEAILARIVGKVKKAERSFSLPLGGERILVALSGGWDSLTLLLALEGYRRAVKEKPELLAANVTFQGEEVIEPSSALLDFLAARGHRLVTLEDEARPASCHLCRLRRRKLLLEAAGDLSCGVLALGHTLDDFAETLLLSLMYAGRIEGLAPRREYFGRVTVVRPLIFVRKREVLSLGRALGFPPPPPPCALGLDSRRLLVREILERFSRGNRHVVRNILSVGLKALARESK